MHPVALGSGHQRPELGFRIEWIDLAPIPVTATGPDLDALDQLCRVRPVRAIYMIPAALTIKAPPTSTAFNQHADQAFRLRELDELLGGSALR
ncbi:hypothetical protein [Nonomuraea diastatica]|uniref:hypothetical protein n=1 Tax=Nonomuraea diastatica TaxID=1848329 RepID=UPI001FE6DD15|nr:hypothetical protein [Nonomuraea diastatica]